MKWNASLLCLLALLLIGTSIRAQLFIELEGGYNFDFLPDEMGDGNVNSTIAEGMLFSLAKHSYGNGISYGAVVGYKINERISTGLGVAYLSGVEGGTSIITSIDNRSKLGSGSMIRIRPEILLNFAFHNRWNLYSKLGFIIGLKNKITIQSKSNNANSTTIKDGGLSFGILNEVGASVKISPKINLNFGLNLILQSYAPDKSEITISMVNGVNNLDNILASDRFVIYQNQYQSPLGGNNLNEPSIRLKKYYLFSSLGIQLSATYNLSTSTQIIDTFSNVPFFVTLR